MVGMTENEDKRAVIKSKLRQYFDGKIVRKDLTKKIKEGANVPVYNLITSTPKKIGTEFPSAFGNSRLSKCLMWILTN